MPYKKKGKKKSGKRGNFSQDKRILEFKGDMEEYAKIMKSLGDRKMNVILPDGIEMIAIIPGRFRKRCWMSVGDIVLVSRREFQDNKLDIIHKYNDEEKHKLHKIKEIPTFFLTQDATCDDRNNDVGFSFEDIVIEEPEPEKTENDDMFDDI